MTDEHPGKGVSGNKKKKRPLFNERKMAVFSSDAAAYVIGVLVGIIGAAAVVVIIGVVLYRKLNLAQMEDENDEELKALRSRVSVYAEQNTSEERLEDGAHVLTQDVAPAASRPRFATAADAKLAHRQ